MAEYRVFAPDCVPEVVEGASIAEIVTAALRDDPLQNGDILLLAHKIVSKAEGCMVELATVAPTLQAREYSAECGRDPRLMQVIMDQSSAILTHGSKSPMICRHRLGLVCANAAVDCSNVKIGHCITLPTAPDVSAHRIRVELEAKLNIRIGVVICDTHGRPFRFGACGVAVGASGITLEKNYIGQLDRVNRIMLSSVECVGDELAAAATLVMGQGNEGRPLAVVRGLSELMGIAEASEIIRPIEDDIFYLAITERGT